MAQHLLDQIDQLDEQERFNRPVDDAAICALRHIAADDTGIETRSEQLALLQALAAADEYRGFPDDIEPNGEWTDDYDAGTDDGHSDSSGDSDDDIHPTELGNLAIDEQAARARWLDPEPPSDDADAASDADDADDAGDADDAMDPACDAVKAFEALETYIKDKKITNWRCGELRFLFRFVRKLLVLREATLMLRRPRELVQLRVLESDSGTENGGRMVLSRQRRGAKPTCVAGAALFVARWREALSHNSPSPLTAVD